MTEIAAGPELRPRTFSPWPLAWASALALAVIMHMFAGLWPWAVSYPEAAVVPVARWVAQFMAFLQANFTWLTRGLAQVLDVPLDAAFAVLARGYKIGSGAEAFVIPRLSWLGVCAAVAIAGYSFSGPRLAALGGGCLLYIALFGQWDSAMLTLALILVCVPICVVTGLLIGIWGYLSPNVNRDRKSVV